MNSSLALLGTTTPPMEVSDPGLRSGVRAGGSEMPGAHRNWLDPGKTQHSGGRKLFQKLQEAKSLWEEEVATEAQSSQRPSRNREKQPQERHCQIPPQLFQRLVEAGQGQAAVG